jgi:hypothetical protein
LSAWGHDFRPNYLKLREFRNKFPTIPIMAVTATAKEQVVKEIIKFLQLKNPQIIRANFDRPNLYIECRNVPKIMIGKKEKLTPYDQVIREYIDKYTMIQYSSTFTIPISTTELTNQVNNHCRKILIDDYDYSGFVRIGEWNIRVDDFERVMYKLYKLAITIPTYIPQVYNTSTI